MRCYEVKKCYFNGTNPAGSKCPPHREQVGCWEYDWLSFYAGMPDCAEKYEWRETMLKICPECQVYKLHKPEIDGFLRGLAAPEGL